jgi:hypothetical protein
MVLTNPPFGRKPSVTYVTEAGEIKRESTTVVQDDRPSPKAVFLLEMAKHPIAKQRVGWG